MKALLLVLALMVVSTYAQNDTDGISSGSGSKQASILLTTFNALLHSEL